MSSGSEPDEPEEDERIAQLYSFASKRCDSDGLYTGNGAEFAAKLDSLGTSSAIVLGSLAMNPATVRAHFAVNALCDVDDVSLSECIGFKKTPLAAVVAAGGAGAGEALCAALESFVFHGIDEEAKREAAVEDYSDVLRALWEWSIVPEEDIKAWLDNERSAMAALKVSHDDAVRIREHCQDYLDWLEEGEHEKN